MAIERDALEERQVRIEKMVDEFRAARQRRLVKQGLALWNRTEAEQAHIALRVTPDPAKIN